MTRALVLVLAAAGASAAPPAPAPAAKVAPRGDALDLLLLGEEPARVELRVEVGGRSVPAIWDETFAALLAYHDRNGDGALDRAEAARLPSPFALRQLLWGQVTTASGEAPPWADLDSNGDGNAGADEIGDFYRRAGLGGVLVGAGRPPAAGRLGDALLKHLDTNRDGRVDEAEWRAAPDLLRTLDANGDELVGPGELVERTMYPGAMGSSLVAPAAPGAKPDAVRDGLPLIVLPLRTADTRWRDVVAARRTGDGLPPLSGDALRSLPTAAPVAAWRVGFGPTVTVAPADGEPPRNGRLTLRTGPLRLDVRAEEGRLPAQMAAERGRLLAAFAACDANSDDALDAKELGDLKAGSFRQLLSCADRDGDGTLTRAELVAWLDLQGQIVKGHVLLSVLDYGHGLFELLDGDRDGALSVRELRAAWDRLKGVGCLAAGRFDRSKLPRYLAATVSRGHPRDALGAPVRVGPDWFVAMDRNGDGDVSRREFTGPPAAFDKLDADKDGLLSPEEARNAERVK